MDLRILEIIDEQGAVQFTGRINVLSRTSRQYLGHLLFLNGEIISAFLKPHQGLKAFYQLVLQEYALESFDYVVEPEVVEAHERQIHYPSTVLKSKLAEMIKLYRESVKHKPPANLKLIVDASFLIDTLPVSPEEFKVLSTITEWNTPNDIYQHCELLDHEITLALVSLRKKGALKTISPRQNP